VRFALLKIKALQAGYGFLQTLWDVSLEVEEGEFIALIGPNGAGKTTTLRSVAGIVRPLGGEIKFFNRSLIGLSPDRIAHLGVCFITEELNLFENMTVKENLILGAYMRRDQALIRQTLAMVLDLFPVLGERQKQLAGTLSGGERRMLALGRGLMADPRLLMVDEPSLGLAPILVATVFKALQELHKQGVTILLVEQNVGVSLNITNRAYVLEHGRIVLSGRSVELRENVYLKETYLGVQDGLVNGA
jgi:branched-chain amino acid transport system ATP-binding protein